MKYFLIFPLFSLKYCMHMFILNKNISKYILLLVIIWAKCKIPENEYFVIYRRKIEKNKNYTDKTLYLFLANRQTACFVSFPYFEVI